MWPFSQNKEFLFKIAIDGRDQGDGRQQNIRDERVDDFCEPIRDTENKVRNSVIPVLCYLH